MWELSCFSNCLFFLFITHTHNARHNNNRKQCQQRERKCTPKLPSSFPPSVILVPLMFDIKRSRNGLFFPPLLQCCVFGKSVIINLPCNMNTYRADTDTKGPSLDLWCGAACYGETEIKVKQRWGMAGGTGGRQSHKNSSLRLSEWGQARWLTRRKNKETALTLSLLYAFSFSNTTRW